MGLPFLPGKRNSERQLDIGSETWKRRMTEEMKWLRELQQEGEIYNRQQQADELKEYLGGHNRGGTSP